MPRYNIKKRPHYDLERLKLLIQNEKTRHLTRNSILNGHELGFSQTEIIDVVLSLQVNKNFFHSMTSHYNNRIWHDVYKIVAKHINLYIKIQEESANKGIIISFKKDDGGGQ